MLWSFLYEGSCGFPPEFPATSKTFSKNLIRSVWASLKATQDRFEKIRAVADQVMMVIRRERPRIEVPSYLPEILDIVNGTGRRISPILALRHEDLRLDQDEHGAICWPADTDKMGKEWTTPINTGVRAAINRARLRSPESEEGPSYLFPSPTNPKKHVSKELASAWLERAEKIAKVEKQKGGLWHPYRRKWATERKHLPDVDVAAAGGWTRTDTMTDVYQQPDMEGMYRVVSEPRRLREVSSG